MILLGRSCEDVGFGEFYRKREDWIVRLRRVVLRISRHGKKKRGEEKGGGFKGFGEKERGRKLELSLGLDETQSKK